MQTNFSTELSNLSKVSNVEARVETLTAPVELDLSILAQVAGGLAPNSTWAVTDAPNSTW